VSVRPRVSIIVPAFQSEGRIGSTLHRLRRQSYTDFEAIVVNDGSTDDTSAVVRDAVEADSRIRLVENDRNLGIATARNIGIEAARGQLIAFLDDDDLWLSRKLELQVARYDAARDAAVVSCYSALVDPAGRLLGWRFGGEPEGDVYEEMLEWDMVSGGSVALVTRAALEEVGGFDAQLPDRADWDLWIRLSRRYPFACVPRVLVGYTRRPGSVSQSYERMLEQGRAVLAKARGETPALGENRHRALLARDLFAITCFCLADGQERLAWHYLTRALRISPGIILKKPRRVAIIGTLVLESVLPASVYRRVFSALTRAAFGLRPGMAFDALE
jgi:glycosyltransferase involved in cell wall biosynthesis